MTVRSNDTRPGAVACPSGKRPESATLECAKRLTVVAALNPFGVAAQPGVEVERDWVKAVQRVPKPEADLLQRIGERHPRRSRTPS